MLNWLKTYLLYGHYFCGVEHALKDGQETLYTTVLKKAKSTLDIENTFESDSVETLVPKLSKKQHVFLIVNNEHVLTKPIDHKESDVEKLVYKAFPNINLDDFYYEIISNNNKHFVSICRKTYVDNIIDSYNTLGLFVINVSLGNLIASSIVDFVNANHLLTSNSNISIAPTYPFIGSIEKTNTNTLVNYHLNGLDITNNQVLSCSAALNVAIENYWPQTNFNTLSAGILKDAYKQARFFNLFLKMGLAFILGLLLINFFVFNHYFKQVNHLQQTSQINQTTKQTLLKLDDDVKQAQKLVEDMLKSNASKSSFYANAIIQSLPSAILLSELNYQPLEKNIKKDKTISLKNKTIILSGISNQSDLFSKYIAQLEVFDWIRKVEILNYEDVSKSRSKFSLKLHMNREK